MKFMMMHKHDPQTEAGVKPPPELIAAMGKLVGGMAQAGKLLDGAGLGATVTRSRLSFQGGDVSVVHGPFEGGVGELPAGFVMVKVQSRDEAIEWGKKLGRAVGGDLEVEVSRVNEPWDIGVGEKPPNAPERYLIIHKATAESEAGHVPDLGAVKQEMNESGVLLSAVELSPSSRATRLLWRKGERQVTDGPFAESKELIGGFCIVELDSLQECMDFCVPYAEILLTTSDTLEIDIRPIASV